MELSKLRSYLTALIVVSSLLVIGCNDKSENKIDYSITDSEQIVKQYDLENVHKFKKAEYYTGNVVIKRTMNQEVVIEVTKDSEQEPTLFILQTERIDPLNIVMPNAELIYLRKALVVNNLDLKQTLLFSLSKKFIDSDLLSGISFDNSYKGFGLGKYTGITINMDDIETADSFFSARAEVKCQCCTSPIITPDPCTLVATGDCDAGGEGSTSCSITVFEVGSCDVECGAGATACCWET